MTICWYGKPIDSLERQLINHRIHHGIKLRLIPLDDNMFDLVVIE